MSGGKNTVESSSWNIMIGMGHEPDDHELFFGDVSGIISEDDRAFSSGADDIDMIDIMVLVGVFPSKTIARKNGWGEDREPTFQWKERGHFCVVQAPGRRVPKGFTLFRAGKGKATEIAILHVD